MVNTALQPGTMFATDFRIVRPLARGGMGQVFVAEQISTGRQRALKVMLGDLGAKPESRRRFVQEAKVGAAIESEHVVQVVAAGDDATTGALWLAMELLEGEDLRTRLDRVGTLAPSEVVRILEQVAHAIDAAHARGVVHRDLKPENVFLASTRRSAAGELVKVLDFGIAKLVDETRTSHTGAIGTPLWMSPEQSQPGGTITSAADIWALGLIAFRALTGAPFWLSASGPNMSAMALLREILIDPMPPASARAKELGAAAPPAGFDAWFGRCSARDPKQRFPSAGVAVAALASTLDGDPRALADTARPTGFGAPIGATATRAGAPGVTAIEAAPTKKARPVWPFLVGGLAAVSAVVVAVVLASTSSSASTTAGSGKPSSSARRAAPPNAPAPSSTPSARVSASASPAPAPSARSASCASCPKGKSTPTLDLTIKGAGASVKSCYTDGLLRGEKGGGAFVVDITIGPSGETCDIVVRRDELGMPAVSTCMINRLRARGWPAPEGGCHSFVLPLELKER